MNDKLQCANSSPPVLLTGLMLCILTSFTVFPRSVRTAFTLETFPEDVTGLVTRSSIKARIFFAAAVLTVNEGTSRLKKKTTTENSQTQ